MTWKSTALVSGAGLLATWLASVPSPAQSPAPAAQARPVAVTAPAPVPASSDIEALAERLGRRNQAVPDYGRPARNLFRFAPLRTSAPRVDAPPPALDVPVQPAGPQFRLSGVAMDRVDGADVWTAILTTPAGLVLARRGEDVIPGWTVATIEAESVMLTRPDGSTVVIPLSGK